MKDTDTVNSFNAAGDYRIEVSGWSADNNFFVERANLVWKAGGAKEVRLVHQLPEGAIIFARSISSGASILSLPVAFQAKSVVRTESQSDYRVELVQMRPRAQSPKVSRKLAKESSITQLASNSKEAKKSCETRESETELEHEEILR